MTDEERLAEAVATALYDKANDETRRWAKMAMESLHKKGVTLTIEPVPEPTYTITLTRTEQKMVMRALQFTQRNNACLDHGECDGYLELWERVQMLEPDQELTR